MALHHGRSIVEETEPTVAMGLKHGRVGLERGVEPIARQLDVVLGAVARVLHRHGVHRHAVRPLSGAGLGHHDVLQRASGHGPCRSCVSMSESNSNSVLLFHIFVEKVRWI